MRSLNRLYTNMNTEYLGLLENSEFTIILK